MHEKWQVSSATITTRERENEREKDGNRLLIMYASSNSFLSSREWVRKGKILKTETHSNNNVDKPLKLVPGLAFPKKVPRSPHILHLPHLISTPCSTGSHNQRLCTDSDWTQRYVSNGEVSVGKIFWEKHSTYRATPHKHQQGGTHLVKLRELAQNSVRKISMP